MAESRVNRINVNPQVTATLYNQPCPRGIRTPLSGPNANLLRPIALFWKLDGFEPSPLDHGSKRCVAL